MAGPGEVSAYLAALPDDQRAALERLRAQIRAAAPDATETISYQMPAFKDQGRFLVSYNAYKEHCSLYPGTGRMMELFGDELEPFFAGKGTLRFTPERPIPARLVKKIVRTRLEENEELRRKPKR
jgi:uncharacterized protein YdhG (YjbR/CyaY superfamily)